MSVVEVNERDGVALWSLNNPPVNAISFEVLETMEQLLTAAEVGDALRAVVITGHGMTFAAGADIQGFMKLGGGLPDFMRKGAELYRRLESSRLPIVAAINGVAYGGGNELAMAADIRLASVKARFGQPEVNLGIIPGWGGTVRLPRLVGMAHARRLLLTGDPIDAKEAYRIGLVDQVVDPQLLVDTALNVADRLASLPPLALQAIKTLLADPGADSQDRETAAIQKLMMTADALEGLRAFMEKRRPTFQGH
ncbi:enoyl-CoA hydratase/isomerase family protein [Sulfobacillus harzensis]|uniref:Short-chain dehydrogenase n=1 Tax=Sulfobacillus harzensis TaxID=2729629 RepID=A0A7Y0Q3J6_9FIRM|nr:enoyl-CoA hydratase-related protein [Sulfobacillus harzensis]NMP23627.1 short-chain dehydrogenase [Sulfobacillus harzensis]